MLGKDLEFKVDNEWKSFADMYFPDELQTGVIYRIKSEKPGNSYATCLFLYSKPACIIHNDNDMKVTKPKEKYKQGSNIGDKLTVYETISCEFDIGSPETIRMFWQEVHPILGYPTLSRYDYKRDKDKWYHVDMKGRDSPVESGNSVSIGKYSPERYIDIDSDLGKALDAFCLNSVLANHNIH